MPSSPNGPCRIGSTTSTWPSVAAGAEFATTGSVSTLASGSSPRREASSQRPVAVDLDHDRLVAVRVERGHDRARRRDRDVVLARASAREDGDPYAPAHGSVVVVSTKRPTKRVTSELGLAWVLPTGSCETTMPSNVGSSVSSSTTRVRKPACSSVVCAMATSCVVTSGISRRRWALRHGDGDGRALGAFGSSARRLASHDAGGLVGVLVDRDTLNPPRWSSDAAWS